MEHFADNLRRLLGLHAIKISSREEGDASMLIGLSPQALSELQSGTRSPSLKSARRIASFFGLSVDRLADAPFEELLAHELADPTRYLAVETQKRDLAARLERKRELNKRVTAPRRMRKKDS
jgi:transcriptional regulator with XRE-family HTH domain